MSVYSESRMAVLLVGATATTIRTNQERESNDQQPQPQHAPRPYNLQWFFFVVATKCKPLSLEQWLFTAKKEQFYLLEHQEKWSIPRRSISFDYRLVYASGNGLSSVRVSRISTATLRISVNNTNCVDDCVSCNLFSRSTCSLV